MKTLLLLLLSLWTLFAFEQEPSVFSGYHENYVPSESETAGISEKPQEQLIYLNLEKIPKKIYVGQIFPVTLKITSLEKEKPFFVRLKNGKDVSLVQEPDLIAQKAINHLTYYFKATGKNIRLPDFTAAYDDDPVHVYETKGVNLKAIRLNPPDDFCNVLAKNMELVNYQASSYTKQSNIVALQLKVYYGNYDDFQLGGSSNQGIDSYAGELNDTILFYYAIFPSEVEKISFSYFNLDKNRYEKFKIPIIVKRSSVSTQINLDPQGSEFTKFKIMATAVLIFFWLILWLNKKRWIYPVLILLAGGYLVTYLIPLKKVCIKPQSRLYLLPTPQSTPFMTFYERTIVKQMNHNSEYTKIKLPNDTIGWVKNEDICSN